MANKKSCSKCYRPYYRRNLIEVWNQRNHGKRRGWGKAIAKVCCDCMKRQDAQAVMLVAKVHHWTI